MDEKEGGGGGGGGGGHSGSDRGTDGKFSLVHKASASASASVAGAAASSSKGARESPKDDNPRPCKRRPLAVPEAVAAGADEKKLDTKEVVKFEDFGTGFPDLVVWVAAWVGRDAASIVFQYAVRKMLLPMGQPEHLASYLTRLDGSAPSPGWLHERLIKNEAGYGVGGRVFSLVRFLAALIRAETGRWTVTPRLLQHTWLRRSTWIVCVANATNDRGRQVCPGCCEIAYVSAEWARRHKTDAVNHRDECPQLRCNAVPSLLRYNSTLIQAEFYLPCSEDIRGAGKVLFPDWETYCIVKVAVPAHVVAPWAFCADDETMYEV